MMELKMKAVRKAKIATPTSTSTAPAATTAIFEPKPIKKSVTGILCELTRLKSQQKYLECNQVKLNPNNFLDDNDNDSDVAVDNIVDIDADIGASDDAKANDVSKNGSSSNSSSRVSSATKRSKPISKLITEIEYLKVTLKEKLQAYRQNKYNELQDMWQMINTIKDDIKTPERLNQYPLSALRERIIGVNTQLDKLTKRYANELLQLKVEYEAYERNNKIIWR